MKKRFNILFTFPQVKSAFAQTFATVEATDIGQALARGFKQVKNQKGIKGARLKEGKITWTVEAVNSD